MNDKLKIATEKFDNLAIRIRLLFTLVAMALLSMLVDFLWIADNFNKAKSLKAEITQTENNINDLINAQDQLNENVINAKNHPLLKDIKQLDLQIGKYNKILNEKTINLIKPEIMTSVLNEIIQRSKKLKILSLTKQLPIALFSPENQIAEAKTAQLQIYRHLVEITFEGQYEDTEDFIRRLEDMPQKVNFESFTYEVEKHPLSKIILVVSTLSFKKEWIGG